MPGENDIVEEALVESEEPKSKVKKQKDSMIAPNSTSVR